MCILRHPRRLIVPLEFCALMVSQSSKTRCKQRYTLLSQMYGRLLFYHQNHNPVFELGRLQGNTVWVVDARVENSYFPRSTVIIITGLFLSSFCGRGSGYCPPPLPYLFDLESFGLTAMSTHSTPQCCVIFELRTHVAGYVLTVIFWPL